MNFYQFFSTFVGHFCPPGSGSGFRIRIRSGSETLEVRQSYSDHLLHQGGAVGPLFLGEKTREIECTLYKRGRRHGPGKSAIDKKSAKSLTAYADLLTVFNHNYAYVA